MTPRVRAANRRKLARLWPSIDEALRTASRAGFSGGLDPDEQAWLARSLAIAWNELDLVDHFHNQDRRRLSALLRRVEQAL